ncbi:hypothetical protein AN4776.2 [Aspergillus nidulans FGSC A4]|uniref:Dihydrofolate reductase (AFU_orthologue AFUA_3G06620) n=1 Tax=Emericella nidulans (strain FGSC A4 / ATCC 38163 / CBS 112.46 / NRRL 194 / M139) TaxID=227321 RepID=Q5B3V4_EMENI|nr:hypothetical protein [Aspergillus nidulans FGSC A4]EAA60346.1 hypothetical protein AN4776.2 [Aspergillus nidulans FGSC A4]CBF76804.1 TPA: dihydrofolate reductase (AFU_orthologue; AFUA_3G06620) [Aspergillus nidulans FGSC A4]|eukprot:XP_662380.1 hypothetical protein AN4776.2 [Aspergillus nidulans FGSC A4]
MAGRPPLKLLMLHGYTQSGPLFHAKSRALIKHITKAFPLHEISAIYPTGPLRLNPADIPGYTPAHDSNGNGDDKDTEIEAYGWYRRSNTAEPPLYVGLEDGLNAIAKVLGEEGPFDGVIGFSQGAAMAAMVASLLEGEKRREAFARFASSSCSSSETTAEGIPYPDSFAELDHPAMKFVLCYRLFMRLRRFRRLSCMCWALWMRLLMRGGVGRLWKLALGIRRARARLFGILGVTFCRASGLI